MPASEASRDEESFEKTQDHSTEAGAETTSLADNSTADADKNVADEAAAGADDNDAAGAEAVSSQAEDPASAEADSSGEPDAAEDDEEQLDAVAAPDKKSSRRRFSWAASGGRRRARASSGSSSTSHRRTRGGSRNGAGSAGLGRRPVFVAIAIAAVLAVGVTGLVMGVLAYVKAKDAQEESIRFSDVLHVEDALSEAANRYEKMEEFFRQFNGKFRSGHHDFDDAMGMEGWMGGKEGWMGGRSGPWGSMPGKGLEGDWGGWKEMPGAGLWGSVPGEGLEGGWGGWKEMPGEGLEGDWGEWKDGEGLWGSMPGEGLEGDLDLGDFGEFLEMLGGLFGLSDSTGMEDWMGSDGMDKLSDLAGENIPEGQLREMFEGVLESFQGNSTSLESPGLNCESDELTSSDSDDSRSIARWMLCEWSSETDAGSSAASTGRRT